MMETEKINIGATISATFKVNNATDSQSPYAIDAYVSLAHGYVDNISNGVVMRRDTSENKATFSYQRSGNLTISFKTSDEHTEVLLAIEDFISEASAKLTEQIEQTS